MSIKQSNLQSIFNIIETFIENCTIISGIHVKEETGNLIVFFSDELPASSLDTLKSDIKEQSSEHNCIYNEKEYSNKTKKFVDAHLTFYEGTESTIEERVDTAFAKLKANFKQTS